VQGVVDSEDLPLNVSRETIQSNKVMERIKTALTHKLIDELKKLAVDNKEKYAEFWKQFGAYLKEGVALDHTGREKLYPLLRFRTSKVADTDLATLNDYVGRMKPDQKQIYYVLADSAKAAALSPHLDYFRQHDLEVLYLTDPLDSFMVQGLRQFEGFDLKSVDDPSLDLPKPDEKSVEPETPQTEFDSLIARFKSQLGDKVTDVRASERLVDSPARRRRRRLGPRDGSHPPHVGPEHRTGQARAGDQPPPRHHPPHRRDVIGGRERRVDRRLRRSTLRKRAPARRPPPRPGRDAPAHSADHGSRREKLQISITKIPNERASRRYREALWVLESWAFGGYESFSSSSIIPLITSNPPCQNLAEAMLIPASVRIFVGDSEPPYSRILRYFGLNFSPSFLYI